MEEPSRIGLTVEAGVQLDEILEDLNPEKGHEGIKLIKFDLYRLAVAIGIKKGAVPPNLNDKSNASFRVIELDPDRVLFVALESTSNGLKDSSVYGYIERLAEQSIRELYQVYSKTGELPLEEYFTDIAVS